MSETKHAEPVPVDPPEPPKEVVVGSVVQLKSGGPTMTVQAKLEKGQCDCAWFDKQDQCCVQRHTFAIESLEVVDDKDSKTKKSGKAAA